MKVWLTYHVNIPTPPFQVWRLSLSHTSKQLCLVVVVSNQALSSILSLPGIIREPFFLHTALQAADLSNQSSLASVMSCIVSPPPQFICRSPNHPPPPRENVTYLELEVIMKHEVISVGSDPIWLVSLSKGEIWRQSWTQNGMWRERQESEGI